MEAYLGDRPYQIFPQRDFGQGKQKMRLRRLNMDNSWCLQIGSINLVVDPWLKGYEVDYAAWFNKQWHKTPPTKTNDQSLEGKDSVLITQKYSDHYHRPTLKDLHPDVVFAPGTLREELNKLLPNASLNLFTNNADTFVIKGVTIKRLPVPFSFGPTYYSYLISTDKESILIANHGLTINDEIRTLFERKTIDVLLSPFNEYRLPAVFGGFVSPGLPALERLVLAVQPRKIISTHDEIKHGQGLIPALAKIKVFDQEMVDQLPWLRGRHLNIPDYNTVSI